MTMLIKISIDSMIGREPIVLDIDNEAHVEKLKAMDWWMYLIHLEEGETIEFKCLERDDRWRPGPHRKALRGSTKN